MAEPGVVASARVAAGRRLGSAWRGCRGLIGDWARTLPLERLVLRLLVPPGWRSGLFDAGRRCADEIPFLKPLSHAPFPQEVHCTLPSPPGAPAPGRSGPPGASAPGRTGHPGAPAHGRSGHPGAPAQGRHAGPNGVVGARRAAGRPRAG